jgi:homocysteine S-methyltransferase
MLVLDIHFCFAVTSGDYGEAGTVQFLKDFHRRRLQVLAEASPDLIAFETIPNKVEAQVYYFVI